LERCEGQRRVTAPPGPAGSHWRACAVWLARGCRYALLVACVPKFRAQGPRATLTARRDNFERPGGARAGGARSPLEDRSEAGHDDDLAPLLGRQLLLADDAGEHHGCFGSRDGTVRPKTSNERVGWAPTTFLKVLDRREAGLKGWKRREMGGRLSWRDAAALIRGGRARGVQRWLL
jgi:hypothetical protein